MEAEFLSYILRQLIYCLVFYTCRRPQSNIFRNCLRSGLRVSAPFLVHSYPDLLVLVLLIKTSNIFPP